MRGKPKTVDEYLATVPASRRAALEQVRATVRALLPDVEECISYSMPAFRHEGHVVAGLLATAKGCSYLPFSGQTLATLAEELTAFSQTKSSLHFDPAHPLSKALIRKLLRARIAEINTISGRTKHVLKMNRRSNEGAPPMKKSVETETESPSRLIDARIEELGDWRGKTLAKLRALILQAVPLAVEEWKWRGVPVWYHEGMLCTGETYKSVVKVTFANGASLEDPSGLFNSSLEGSTRRAIDFHEGDPIPEAAFKALVRNASALNCAKSKGAPRAPKKSTPGVAAEAKAPKRSPAATKPRSAPPKTTSPARAKVASKAKSKKG